MSYMATGILSVVAGSLALGAVQLEVAAGNDLLGPALASDTSTTGIAADYAATSLIPNVNRSLKGDRMTTPQSGDGVTISFRIPGVDSTSIMMRVPVSDASDSAKRNKTPVMLGTQTVRRTVACEPIVSVLTAVAKQLQPGRCVT